MRIYLMAAICLVTACEGRSQTDSKGAASENTINALADSRLAGEECGRSTASFSECVSVCDDKHDTIAGEFQFCKEAIRSLRGYAFCSDLVEPFGDYSTFDSFDRCEIAGGLKEYCKIRPLLFYCDNLAPEDDERWL